MLLWLVGVAWADEVRVALGGQLEAASHGILDVGWRRGPLSVQWQTDTLDVRLGRTEERGSWSIGLRAASVAAGMWITPWTDGAPDLTRAQRATYIGPDVQVQRYLPNGWWVGAAGFARPHRFRPLPGSTLDVPPTSWSRAQATAGLWRDNAQARLAVGVDATTHPGDSGVRTAPHAFFDAAFTPDTKIAPILSLRAGVAAGQDEVTATRVGGMTPYHVPLAGAGWAEFWVEDFVAARAGAIAHLGPIDVSAAVDTVAWTPGEGAVGLEGRLRWHDRALYAEVAVGFSPTISRPVGIWRVPVFLVVGTQWLQPGRG